MRITLFSFFVSYPGGSFSFEKIRSCQEFINDCSDKLSRERILSTTFDGKNQIKKTICIFFEDPLRISTKRRSNRRLAKFECKNIVKFDCSSVIFPVFCGNSFENSGRLTGNNEHKEIGDLEKGRNYGAVYYGFVFLNRGGFSQLRREPTITLRYLLAISLSMGREICNKKSYKMLAKE